MTRFDRFICSEDTGVTRFDLPPGPVNLWLEPECDAGYTAAGRFRTPAPIVREVTTGEVITLDTQLIEVDQSSDSGCPGAANCLCQVNDSAASLVDPVAVPGLDPPRLRAP